MPALVVADELTSRGIQVSWLGTREGIEADLVPDRGYSLYPIQIQGLRKSGWMRKLLLPVALTRAMFQSAGLFRRLKPDVVLGMGGFASGPGGLVAGIFRVPIVLHEQNSVAGLTNKWLARISRYCLGGFPDIEGLEGAQWVGNPVNNAIAGVPEPEQRYAGREGEFRVLVVGGSQGAQVFNEQMPGLLARSGIEGLVVRHQCGKQGGPEIATEYQRHGISSSVETFVNDMKQAYAWCDLVICRAGAMTVSELCCAGVPAIFVPYPYAVSDHQAVNAHFMAGRDAAIMVRQPEFVAGNWLDELRDLANNRGRLLDMARKARTLGRQDSAARVADYCMEAICASS